MKFSSEGYIIRIRHHGEKSAIITVVCPQYGKVVGYVNGALSKKKLGIYQLGNRISFNAYARVEENMFSFKGVELTQSYAADFMLHPEKTEALSALCGLLDMCVAENDDLGEFFYRIDDFFKHLNHNNWLVYYSLFEYNLLEFLGIGLDLSKCAVTGKRDDLLYVSPKTGRAVCAEVGSAYKNKLYAYPSYIVEQNYSPQQHEIANVLTITGNFLTKNFLKVHNLTLPKQRNGLICMVNQMHKM